MKVYRFFSSQAGWHCIILSRGRPEGRASLTDDQEEPQQFVKKWEENLPI